jgi:signal transduction histidine kinase
VVFPGLENGGALWSLLFSPLPLVALVSLIPGTRVAEAGQARLLLFPSPRARGGRQDGVPLIAASPSASWQDRGRVFVWLTIRLWLGFAVTAVTLEGAVLALALLLPPLWPPFDIGPLALPEQWHWWFAAFSPLVAAASYAVMWGTGALMAALAPRLLGPSRAERLAELEERTERLLERNRLARELHDTIGHALTVAVLQAGAAREAGSPEFTDRALAVIEDTGREALTDLERVLRLLREDADPAVRRPTLAALDRLLESARGLGTEIGADIEGDLGSVPGPVSREAYRMLQECLTNALRHAEAAPVDLRVRVGRRLELDVRNKLPGARPAGEGSGSGLRGIRERAALLGGAAEYGPSDGTWRVRITLPLQ